jgi:flagellar capping protein FliD
VNWVDGIEVGGTFTVKAGPAGATEYTWTNSSGKVIADIDTFVSEWNKATNWSGSSVAVKVIKEGDNELRFFSASQSATATFTLTANSANDLYELGVVTTPPTEIPDGDTNLEGVWHFNEGTGTSATDGTSNANDGTISGATWSDGDFFSKSLDFDGTDDYVEVTGSASLNLNGSGNFTIEGWINPDTYGGGFARILSKSGVEIYIDSATEAVFATINTDGTSATVQSAASSLPTTFSDKWYHVAVTYDSSGGVNDKTKIYINGTDVTNTGTDTVTGNVVDDLNNLYIGNDTAGGGGNPFDGQIDEVAIYNGTTKTPAQIASDALTTIREVTVSSGALATASAQYNALSYAYDMNAKTSSTGIWVTTGVTNTTDSTVSIDLTSNTLGYYGFFGIADEDISTPGVSTVADYFGSSPQTSTYASDVAIGTAGEDAYFSVDNINYTRTSNAVDDVIGGATLKLGNTSASNVILNIEVNTDKGIDKLADFIVVYNRTLEMLNPPRLSDFQKGYLEPLTDEVKETMTDREIELYEKLHETYNGYKFIQQESSFRRLHDYFRLNTTADVDGLPEAFNSILDLNIIPGLIGTDEDARKGYLISGPKPGDDYKDYIKETLESNFALLGFLKNKSEEVFDLFANDSSISGGSDGVARVLTDKIDSYVLTNGILKDQIKVSGSIDKDIRHIDEQIIRWEERLEKKEDSLWRKFIKMEEAIQNLTFQSQNLTSMLSKISSQQNNR